jgi:hypothetical protein
MELMGSNHQTGLDPSQWFSRVLRRCRSMLASAPLPILRGPVQQEKVNLRSSYSAICPIVLVTLLLLKGVSLSPSSPSFALPEIAGFGRDNLCPWSPVKNRPGKTRDAAEWTTKSYFKIQFVRPRLTCKPNRIANLDRRPREIQSN